MRAMNRAVLLWILAVLGPQVAWAGAWLRSEGEHLYAASLSYSRADAYWDKGGDRTDAGCTFRNTWLSQTYEYGYSYHYTLFGNLGAAGYRCGGEDVSGLADLKLGVRGRLDPFVNGRAWELAVIVPTGYDKDRSPRLGYGRLGAEGSLTIQVRPDKKNRWQYGAGLRLWQGAPAELLFAHLRYDRRVTRRWRLGVGLAGDFSLRNGGSENIDFVTRDNVAEYDAVEVSARVRYRVSRWTDFYLNLSRDVWGRNTNITERVQLGFSHSWGR